MMIKASKALLALGILLFVSGAVLLTVTMIDDGFSLPHLALALLATGWAVSIAGLAIVLRWQSRILGGGLTVQAAPSVPSLTAEDLSELVRVIDSRVVGLIETMRDVQAPGD